MAERERIVQVVYRAIDELNRQLPGSVQIEKAPDAVLYGKTGKLESLDFVTFIMEVEERVRDEFGTEVVLTDENLLSKQSSPFQTVGTLVDHLEKLLDEEGSGS